MMNVRAGCLLAGWALIAFASSAKADPSLADKMDQIVQAGTFSGAILVTRDGGIVFDKAYGYSDAERHLPNLTSTRFHLGSLSAQFTAAAALLEIEKGRLWLTNTADQFVPNGGKATVGDLLAHDPGAKADQPAFNLLAHILEAETGKPFADVLDTDFFGPLWMQGSGLDGGDLADDRRMAKGYHAGTGDDRVAAPPVAWAERLGDGSAYVTTRDELRWVDAFFADRLITADSRRTLAKLSSGWLWDDSTRFGGEAYAMAGAAPGFNAFVVHLQAKDVTVIVLSNVESAEAVQKMADDLAALAGGG